MVRENLPTVASREERLAARQQLLAQEKELTRLRPHRDRDGQTTMPWDESLRGDWPGISVFLQVDGTVYHTYYTFGRGIEDFHNGYPYLDLTALGRQEEWEEPKGRATPLGLRGRPSAQRSGGRAG